MKKIKAIAQVCILVAFASVYEMDVNGSDAAMLSPIAMAAMSGFGLCCIVWISNAIATWYEKTGVNHGQRTDGEFAGRMRVDTRAAGEGRADARTAA